MNAVGGRAAAGWRAGFSSAARERREPPVLFLGVPMAINVRDVLRTEAFEVLRASGARIHLFTAAADSPEFLEEFGGEGIEIHPLRSPESRRFQALDALALRLHVAILSLRCDTARIMVAETLRRSPLARTARASLRAIGRRGQDALIRLLRAVVRRAAPELYGEEFSSLRPDLVVGTRVLTMSAPGSHSSPRYLDRHLLVSAGRRGVPTMVLVSSWDNLTTSGFFPVDVDRITVWNGIMERQAVEIHGLDPERIVVTGAPQHDVFTAGAYTERCVFLTRLGLDPGRPVVVYATGTDGTVPDEPLLALRVEEALHAGLDADVQLLVRVHQLDSVERYGALAGRSGIAFDQAGRPPSGAYHDRDFDRRALERLADTLRHADVVLNAASSISIDAAAVDTPVVCVDFDARDGVPYHRSVTRFYDFTHQRAVMASGGVARVRSPEELVEAVRRYLADPGLDAEGRRRLVGEQCHVLDGRAGRRVGEAVLGLLVASAEHRRR